MSKKPALGRGLSALLENAETDITSRENKKTEEGSVGAISNIKIENIEANPFQPRSKFEEEALNELASSIKELGIIQPLTVRKVGYGKYQLISGERRLKASKIAGFKEIPAFIRIANDQAMLEMALVENIQRENLDAIEIGISYQRLIDECQLTQEAMSERVGKKRSTITNYIRLLKLPAEIQMAIQQKAISMGHARALINIKNNKQQLSICNQILEKGLSVRQTEELARQKINKESGSKKLKKTSSLLPQEESIQKQLSTLLSAKVKINSNEKGKGKIVISFKDADEMERISELLNF